MEHWANRLYPKYTLDDCLTKIDQLGKKKTVQRHLSQYRMNMLDPIVSQTEETSDKEDNNQEDEPIDEYEDLINQQIALSTVNNTSTSRANNSFNSSAAFDELSASSRTVTIPPKSAPVVPAVEQARLTDELRARIAENKRKAIERFNARQLELAKDQENLVSAPVDDVITSQNIEIEATQEPITQSQENDTSEADTSILSGIHPMADSPQKTQENNTENMEE